MKDHETGNTQAHGSAMPRLSPFPLVALLLVTCFAACSDDSADSGAPDTGAIVADASRGSGVITDVGGLADTGAVDVRGVDTSGVDTGGVETGGEDAGRVDAGGEDGGVEDTGQTTDPYAGRPVGQCTTDSDCPTNPLGANCSEALPGGACLGCGDDAHCPVGASCSDFGACITDCSSDDDCPPGLECLGASRCAAIDCVDGVCPVPLFGCSDSGLCNRIDCSDDANICPDGTTCTDGWCVEDRALR